MFVAAIRSPTWSQIPGPRAPMIRAFVELYVPHSEHFESHGPLDLLPHQTAIILWPLTDFDSLSRSVINVAPAKLVTPFALVFAVPSTTEDAISVYAPP